MFCAPNEAYDRILDSSVQASYGDVVRWRMSARRDVQRNLRDESSPTIIGCRIAENSAAENGGGLKQGALYELYDGVVLKGEARVWCSWTATCASRWPIRLI